MTPRRRRVAAALAAAASSLWTVSRLAMAQPAPKMHRIGVLGPDVSDGQGHVWNAFVDELARRGHVEGRNLVFEKRFGQGDRAELVDRLAAELVALKPDVIYAARGSFSALAAKRATATIPIVFYSSGDPVGMGLVASLARPGGNLTGTSVQGFDIIAKALQLLVEALGKPSRVAYLAPTGTRQAPWFGGLEATLNRSAQALALKVEFVDVPSVDALEPIIRQLVRDRVDVAIVSDFPLFRPQLEHIAELFIKHRLPAYGDAYSGFLMHYGEQRVKLARMAAAYVDRVLAGTKPADLPVEQLSTFELVINQRTAKALGLSVPVALLLRADEVIQ